MFALALGAVLSVGQATASAGTLAEAQLVGAPIHVLHAQNGTVSSTNWSGYADLGETYTRVQGAWYQPTGTCTTTNTAAAFWVGLDGYGSGTVEQLGTEANCNRGAASYYAWYEMYPAASVVLSTTTYPVVPGDQIEAEVIANGTSYELAMRDISASGTTKWTFVTHQTSTVAADASAEWVAEAPSECILTFCRTLPLTDYGTVTFTNAEATGNGAFGPIGSFADNDAITMQTAAGVVKSVPSALAGNGESFAATWEAA